MPVIYNGKKLIPAPFFSCLKEYQTGDDGTPLGKTYHIVVKGRFSANMGSPNSNGQFWDQSGYPPDEVLIDQNLLKSHLNKQQAIRSLFAEQGKTFEVQALDGSMSLRCNPRILQVETPEGNLTTVSDYIVTMECDSLFVNNVEDDAGIEDSHISKASEEWNVEVSDEKLMTYRLTHAVNAVGKLHYDETGATPKKPWEYAKDYVLNVLELGLDNSKLEAQGVISGGDALVAYNYLRGQSLNELTGSFSANETWLCYAGGAAYEEFTVNTRTSIEGRTTVTVNGTITGLARYDNQTAALISSRYDNAKAKWEDVQNALFSRAETQSGYTLNPGVLSKDVGQNEVSGVVTYNYEYDDRPQALLTGAKSTHVNITVNNACDVFASIPIVGRSAGPILQPLGTITAKRITVALTAQMPCSVFGAQRVSMPNSNSVFLDYTPTASQVFIDDDRVEWVDVTGQYSRTVVFTYQ